MPRQRVRLYLSGMASINDRDKRVQESTTIANCALATVRIACLWSSPPFMLSGEDIFEAVFCLGWIHYVVVGQRKVN